MMPISQISSKQVQNVLEKLEGAPYFLEQLNIQNSEKTSRKTYSFGYNYFSLLEKNRNYTLIPNYLYELCQACIDSFPKEMNLGNAHDYKNAIVSFFEPGYCLEPHYDADVDRYSEGKMVDFHFGEHILGVILEADSRGKLYIVKTDNEAQRFNAKKILELDEKVGTTYLMTGAYRHKPYYHGVSLVSRFRVSVTFRTINFDS